MVIVNYLGRIVVMDKNEENAKITEIRYFQLLWKAILEKGRDEEYV